MPGIFSSGGQFGGSAYNNPQMGGLTGMGQQGMTPNPSAYQGSGWGGQSAPANSGYNPSANQWATNQYGWGNTNSPDYNWGQGFAPGDASWVGQAPGQIGQTFGYNPQTGESGWSNNSGGVTFNSTNYGPGGKGNFKYIDPETGMTTYSLGALDSVMNKLGMGNSQFSPQNYQGSGFSASQWNGNPVTPGAGYEGFDYETIGSGIDPSGVIDAQEYKLQEAMQGDFAQAGGRLGQSGMAMSTPYANALGEASRKASQDRNAITMQYQYDAAQQQAARDLQQQMQAAQLDFGGWQTGYGGDLQAQMFNEGNNFDAWAV